MSQKRNPRRDLGYHRGVRIAATILPLFLLGGCEDPERTGRSDTLYWYVWEGAARPSAELLADLMVIDPYTTMYACADASISPTTLKIWDVGHASILSDLGFAEDDVITKVAGHVDPVAMYDAIAITFIYGGEFRVTGKRGATVLDHDVTVVAP